LKGCVVEDFGCTCVGLFLLAHSVLTKTLPK